MIRSSSSHHSTSIWWRALLLPLAVAALSLPEETVCDTYSVELQAVFESDAVVPCSSQETTIIEALIQSLVQTDAIVGLNRMIPVPPFFLAFEKFGRNSTRLSSFAETDIDITQMDLATPFMTVEDHLEDLYYNGTGDHSSSTVAAVVPQDMDYKGDEGEQTPKETPVKDQWDKLTPPASIQMAGGSLRKGSNRRNLRYRALIDTSSPTPAPTPISSESDVPSDVPSQTPTYSPQPSGSPSSIPTMSQAPSESPSDLPSYVPSSFPSDTPTISASDAPSSVPSETPTVSASDAPSNVPSSVASETPTVSASDAPSSVPSETPTVSVSASDAPSESPTASPTPAPTPSPTAPETPAPTPSPTLGSTPAPTPLVDDSSALDCEADWCAWFFTRPCGAIPHDLEQEATEEFRAELEAFQQRVATQIERKLGKWARDTNAMCLGNSWQLKATVKRLL